MTFPVLTTSLLLLQDAAAVDEHQLDLRTPCPEWTVAQVLFHAAGDQCAWASSVVSVDFAWVWRFWMNFGMLAPSE